MKSVLLVFIGGGLGAIIRELFMNYTPPVWDGFPLDIFLANILAAFLLGVAAARNSANKMNDSTYLFIGTGIMGGLSTFSSFVYGAVVLMSATLQGVFVSIVYLILSLIIGYIAVSIGHRIGRA